MPDCDNPLPISVVNAELRDIKVQSFLLPNELAWDDDLIDDIFVRRDADLIRGFHC